MARRRGYIVNLQCTYPGCRALSRHEAETRRDEKRIRERMGTWWKCDEHFGIERRLLPGNEVRVHRMVSKRSEGCGDHLFWDRCGVAHGPGFEARTKDWPEGTVLEVAARIIPPGAQPASSTPIPLRTLEELTAACRNVGVDLSCGECAAIFFTGTGGYPHTCARADQAPVVMTASDPRDPS